MDTREIYRLMAAEHFEVLDAADRHRLDRALQARPDVDPARFREELQAAIASGDTGARTLAFRHGLEAAEAALASPRPRPHLLRTWWKLGVAAVVGAGLAAVFLGRNPEPANRTAQAFVLTADRAAGSNLLPLDATGAAQISLVVEANLDTEAVHWELLAGNLDVIEQGALDLRVGPGLESLAITVDKALLDPGATYWLVLHDGTGNALRRWTFRTE